MGELLYCCAGVDNKSLPSTNIKALMANTVYSGLSEKRIKDTILMIKRSHAEYVMQDSGGFQLAVAEGRGKLISLDRSEPPFVDGENLNIAPTHIVRLAKTVKSTVIFSLDLPIPSRDEPGQQYYQMKKTRHFNAECAIETAALRQDHCPDIELYIPLQLYTLEHLDDFMNRIKGISYDGVGVPLMERTLKELSQFIIRFHQKGIKKVHFFGASRFDVIAYAAYLAQHMFDRVSFDSKTWMDAARVSEYILPHMQGRQRLNPHSKIKHVMNCQCPWCKGKSFNSIKDLTYEEKFDLLRRHNHWTINEMTGECFKNAGSIGELKRFLLDNNKRQEEIQGLYSCLCMVKHFKDADAKTLELVFK